VREGRETERRPGRSKEDRSTEKAEVMTEVVPANKALPELSFEFGLQPLALDRAAQD